MPVFFRKAGGIIYQGDVNTGIWKSFCDHADSFFHLVFVGIGGVPPVVNTDTEYNMVRGFLGY